MYRDNRIGVVIPAYNVETHLRKVIESLPEFVDRIVLVDDASKDGTYAVATSLAHPRLRTIRHKVNQGVGGAVISGYKEAIADGVDVIVKMDGDGQMDPKYLVPLIEPLIDEGYGYSKGNRFLDGCALRTMPWHRLVGNFGLTFLTKLSSGYWQLFDPQNGYTAIKQDVLSSVDLDRISKRFFFENDMLIHLNVFNCRVTDVPIPATYGDERSSMNTGRILFTFPFHLLKGLCYRALNKYILRDFSPIAVFILAGIPLFSWGVCFGLYAWIRSAVSGVPATTGTVMLSVLPLLLGFQLILQSITMEINQASK